MRRKILCTLLSAVLILAMLPAAAVPARAASQMTSSEALVSFIKDFEGFHSQAYVSGGQWTIGYGTMANPGDTITREQADLALRSHLRSLETNVNRFLDNNGLVLSQNQFDALACFTYNCGIAWMSQEGRFRNAVIRGASEEEFLFAISLWANDGGVPSPGLLKRRLAEADMYRNGVYLRESERYTYTIFDPNGGTPGTNGEDKMQGYPRNGATAIRVADPVLPGFEFAGWYTAKDGGTKVTVLNGQTAGKRLYAQYKSNGSIGRDPSGTVSDGRVDSAAVSGTVQCTTYVNIRKGPGTGNALAGRAYNGTRISVYETTTVGAYRWGRTDTGWICLNYVVLDQAPGSTGTACTAGTVTANNVNVRTGPGTQYPSVARYGMGTPVEIYEEQTAGSLRWGRIDTGRWICLAYVERNASGGTTGRGDSGESSTAVLTGRVAAGAALNVRSGPATYYAKVDSLRSGTPVTVYEKSGTDGASWGRIGTDRWICLNYVILDTDGTGSRGTGTGVVISKTNLNVRVGAGTNYGLAAKLVPGARVTILEQTDASGRRWGRTSQGWVCMDYIQMD